MGVDAVTPRAPGLARLGLGNLRRLCLLYRSGGLVDSPHAAAACRGGRDHTLRFRDRHADVLGDGRHSQRFLPLLLHHRSGGIGSIRPPRDLLCAHPEHAVLGARLRRGAGTLVSGERPAARDLLHAVHRADEQLAVAPRQGTVSSRPQTGRSRGSAAVGQPRNHRDTRSRRAAGAPSPRSRSCHPVSRRSRPVARPQSRDRRAGARGGGFPGTGCRSRRALAA